MPVLFPPTELCPLFTVNGGSVTYTNFFGRALATFTCDSGNSLDGRNDQICQENGEWSHNPPSCVGMCWYTPDVNRK